MSISSSVAEMIDRCEVQCIHPEHVTPLVGHVIGALDAESVAETFGLLGDPTRARILDALSLTDELCVCDLGVLLSINQSALSHQLRLLRTARVVSRRKVGRIAYYRLADEHIRHVFADGLRHAREGQLAEQSSA